MEERKRIRKERKLQKIAAYLNMAELNEQDRKASDLTEQSDTINDEPSSKKLKSNDGSSVSTANQDSSDQSNDLTNEMSVNENTAKVKLSESDLAELRALLKQRAKALKKTPLLRLRDPTGFQATLDSPASDRIPIFFSDIQHLVLFAALAQNSPFIPRWCHLEKCGHLSSLRILFIEGAGISDFNKGRESLTSLSESNFPFNLEVVMPAAYNGNLIEEFCAIPLSRSQRNNLVSAYGSVEGAVRSSCEVFRVLRAFFPVKEKTVDASDDKKKTTTSKENGVVNEKQESTVESIPKPSAASEPLPPSDKFPRTSLLLSAWQMIEEGYPITVNADLQSKFKGFVQTKPCYIEVSNFSPMYGVDCEMCVTSIGKNELTRVSIVNEKLETILDTLVLPYNKIINYLTRFSGITPTMMKNVTTRLEDVQKFIQENLEPDAILVGQSLNCDLVALKMMHPYCIDTSVIFNVTGDRYRKSKLSYLSKHFLNESIQESSHGHDSVEDSSASLRLVQLKLSESIEYGDQVLANQGGLRSCSSKQAKKPKELEDLSGYATSLFSYTSRLDKHAAIVGSPEILEKYMDYLNPRIASYEQVNQDGSCNSIARQESATTGGQVTCVITPSSESVLEKVSAKSFDNFLTIGHIKLSEEETNRLSTGDSDTFNMLNHWVTQFQTGALLNGLSIVLLCGREKSSNGVCFINLRTKTTKPVSFQPNNGESTMS